MIHSFADPESERIWSGRVSRRLPRNIQQRALKRLMQLQAASSIDDLRVPPGNRLELLSGDRAGQHSIRVNDQWRICFEWRGDGAYNVEIVDYHG
jgi:proteic killer suppression protein